MRHDIAHTPGDLSSIGNQLELAEKDILKTVMLGVKPAEKFALLRSTRRVYRIELDCGTPGAMGLIRDIDVVVGKDYFLGTCVFKGTSDQCDQFVADLLGSANPR